MMDASFALLLIVIVFGLIFEFVNGFHDAANAVATIIATRVLSPLSAVLMAGVLNFLGAVTGLAVAATVGAGLVDPSAVTLTTVATGLLAAILWDLATWFYGIPTSSSHALLFGVLGAGVATTGFGAVIIGGVELVGIGIIYSPGIGLLAAAAITIVIYGIFRHRRPTMVRKLFSRLQLLSSAYMAYSHGGNDGQKTMGIIALALFTYGTYDSFYVPLWVIIVAALSMGLGTAAGGFRIVKTMGFKLVNLDTPHGFAAETAAATVIEVATRFGVPISTTHAINGAILGVGAVKNRKAVSWGVARSIVTAWVLTLPACFVLGWLLLKLATAIGL
jgi:inorganic phosphate transporter, PiT family